MESLPLAEPLVNDRPHRLTEGVHRIGRKEGNEIIIDHDSVSSYHASVTVQAHQTVVTDHGSTNGTFVNGQRVMSAPLSNDDQLTLGSVELSFRELSPDELSPATVPPPTKAKPTENRQFHWWPQSKAGSRSAIIFLSLTFVIFSLGTPLAGIFAVGFAFLLMSFYRWLSVKTANAFKPPTNGKKNDQPLSKEAVAACGAVGFGIIILVIIAISASSSRRSEQYRPQIQMMNDYLKRQEQGEKPPSLNPF